ncbi:MAG: glycosyltransferase [Hylemonella sp.]|nr:glycosyltransferase [Hylemonella sp.]
MTAHTVYRWMRDIGLIFVAPIFVLLIFIVSRLGEKNGLIWGHTPIINNKYWSDAMRGAGFHSWTLMSGFYSKINKRQDFDLYFDDIFPLVRPRILHRLLLPWLVMLYLAKHARVLHLPFYGGVLRNSLLWRLESYLYRLAKIKTVIIPYGGDMYMYSQIFDPCIRNGLLLSYPQAAKNERNVRAHVNYWVEHADVILVGFTLEGIARWDVPAGNMLAIDSTKWSAKQSYSSADGTGDAVRILHNPNHTGVKGSEFILNAVNVLQQRGLKVELVLLQGVQNSKVMEVMQSADIHADQLILPGYGMSAVEAMASGLPVIANLSDHRYTTIFRRFSFLQECPIFSSTPETIIDDLELLVRSPQLRSELGRASRAYVEKYHSYEATQYLFGAVYDKILNGKEIDLMNLFHPLKSEFSKRKPRVDHPLVANRLPPEQLRRC